MCGRDRFPCNGEYCARRTFGEDRDKTLRRGGKAAAGEADSVVIAGMGGELIIKILENGRHMWDSVSSGCCPRSRRSLRSADGFWKTV